MNRLVCSMAFLLVVGCGQIERGESAWAEAAGMEIARSEHPAVVIDDRIIVIGGLVESGPGRFGVSATVEAYDPASGIWAGLPDLPAPRHHSMAAVVGDRVFSIGGFSESGFSATDAMWELVEGSWIERSRLPEPVGAGAAVVLEGMIFVVGGAPGAGLHRYDPSADGWETLNSPMTFREHLAAVAFQGEVWAIGGREPGSVHRSVEIFDPESNTWRHGPPLRQARSGFGAVVAGDSIYVAGGEVFDPDEALSSAERYDPETREWSEFEPLPIGLHGNPLVSVGNALYLPGGSTRAAGVENAGELWVIEVG